MATDLACFQLILLVLIGSNFRLYFERQIWLNLRCLRCGYSKPLRQLCLSRLLISLTGNIPCYKLISIFLLNLRLYNFVPFPHQQENHDRGGTKKNPSNRNRIQNATGSGNPVKIIGDGLITVAESDFDCVGKVAKFAASRNSEIHRPKSYKEAINDLTQPDPTYGQRWREAIETEVDNLADQNTLEYEELPAGREAIGSKWLFKVNTPPADRSSVSKQDSWHEDFREYQALI